VRTRRKKERLQLIALQSLAGVGAISLAVAAPNALTLLKPLTKRAQQQRLYSTQRAFRRLHEKGLVIIERAGQDTRVRLSEKGQAELARWTQQDATPPRRWDEKWRMVIFDVHESRRHVRDRLRSILVQQGFRELQHSVWVYPYPCEELHVLLKTELRLGKDVLYIIADEIEGDAKLRKLFKLPRRT
jgi:CRISPR-associated endonuclease Cas2